MRTPTQAASPLYCKLSIRNRCSQCAAALWAACCQQCATSYSDVCRWRCSISDACTGPLHSQLCQKALACVTHCIPPPQPPHWPPHPSPNPLPFAASPGQRREKRWKFLLLAGPRARAAVLHCLRRGGTVITCYNVGARRGQRRARAPVVPKGRTGLALTCVVGGGRVGALLISAASPRREPAHTTSLGVTRSSSRSLRAPAAGQCPRPCRPVPRRCGAARSHGTRGGGAVTAGQVSCPR